MPGALLPALADTGRLAADVLNVVDAELAAVYGPWTLQSEWYGVALQNAAPVGSVERHTLLYHGAYVELLYFLTGECRAYNRHDGTFDRVVPNDNFRVRGDSWSCGAWQVGVAYAYLDLQSHGVPGATLNNLTLGLNWFLNPNVKMQWNYALDYRASTPPGSSGFTSIFGMRVACDF
jgi:phosphate-selective porin OprO/OprP